MRTRPTWLIITVIILSGTSPLCSSQRVRVLLTGQIDESVNPLQIWLKSEPLIDFLSVPSRDLRGDLGGDAAMERFIRIYFPRTYEVVSSYDFFLLNSPIFYFFKDEYIRWMYDAIVAGSGGLNTASVMSQDSSIHGAWAQSILQEAFPNNAPAVIDRYQGGTSSIGGFRIVVNEDFPEPVLTPFLPLGIEGFRGHDSRIIISREGAGVLAWQVGNFPKLEEVPFMVGWDYGEGRTITTGDAFGHTFWSSFRGGRGTDNEYALDILMNMIFYSTHRDVQLDVLLFHHMRTSFFQFRGRMGILVSLVDFVERFGASSRNIQKKMEELEDMEASARESYLLQDFEEVEATMNRAFEGFIEAEKEAIELKKRALLWVYIVEWMVTTSVFMISGFVLWTLMVRRRLYRDVQVTRAL